jgi:hypothetical protein
MENVDTRDNDASVSGKCYPTCTKNNVNDISITNRNDSPTNHNGSPTNNYSLTNENNSASNNCPDEYL